MSVSPYTVAHDVEVQQYNQVRAAALAGLKARKRLEAETRMERKQKQMGCVLEEKNVVGKEAGRRAGGMWRRMLGRGGRKETGNGEREGEGKVWDGGFREERKVMDAPGEEWEEWSDAETEVEMVDVLNDGKGVAAGRSVGGGAGKVGGKTGMRTRTERVPPYAFLQAMAGVTAPLGRSGC